MLHDLHKAIENGDATDVKVILAENPSEIRTLNRLGDTPLHNAVWQNNKLIAQLLIEKGADTNAPGNQGNRPLHYAATQGYAELAQMLIDSGADTESKNAEGFSSLFVASRGREPGCPKVANLLIEAGAKLELHSAVCLGRLDDVRRILQSDPNAIAKCTYKEDLVVDAVIANSIDVVELLLSHGADVNASNLSGTPAIFSTLGTRANPSMVETLIRHGADVNAKNQLGKSVLAIAKRGRNQKVIGLLVDAGALD